MNKSIHAWSPARKATFTAASASLVLILIKLFVGLSTGTVVVLASAVDSLLDFLVSSFNAYAVRSAERPSDDAYNYGRGKMEGVASLLEGLFILASALYILREAIYKFFEPTAISSHNLAFSMSAMVISLLITFVLVMYLRRLSKQSESLIIKADTAHYEVDLISNLGILIALGLIHYTEWNWLDPIIAMGISLVVAKAAWPLLKQGLQMLLDRALDEKLVEQIRNIATNHSERVNGVHELKTRQSGDTHFVEFHLVFDEDIKLREAHHIADEIEMRIRKLFHGLWIINIHLDPVDDSHRDIKLAKLNQP